MTPKVERSLWGLQKTNHLIRQISRDGAHLRTRMEVHIRLVNGHMAASLACYDSDMGYPARLHMSAALYHVRMASYVTGMLQQSLTPKEMSDEKVFIEEAVNMGLKAVDETKKKATKLDLENKS